MIQVLFVCMGNICRSPMAEGVFQHLVNEAGLGDQIIVDSAGTGGWHAGERAHSGTRRVLQEHGIPYDGRARQVTRGDLNTFDYVLAMDRDNYNGLQRLAHGEITADIRMFMSFAPDAGSSEVPDPYYDGRFEYVYSLVRQAAEGLLAYLREQHDL